MTASRCRRCAGGSDRTPLATNSGSAPRSLSNSRMNALFWLAGASADALCRAVSRHVHRAFFVHFPSTVEFEFRTARRCTHPNHDGMETATGILSRTEGRRSECTHRHRRMDDCIAIAYEDCNCRLSIEYPSLHRDRPSPFSSLRDFKACS